MGALGGPAGLLSKEGDAPLDSLDVILVLAGCGERNGEEGVRAHGERRQMLTDEMDDGGLIPAGVDGRRDDHGIKLARVGRVFIDRIHYCCLVAESRQVVGYELRDLVGLTFSGTVDQ